MQALSLSLFHSLAYQVYIHYMKKVVIQQIIPKLKQQKIVLNILLEVRLIQLIQALSQTHQALLKVNYRISHDYCHMH